MIPYVQAFAILECARLYATTRESKACQAFYNHAIRARLLAIQDKAARHKMAQEALSIVRVSMGIGLAANDNDLPTTSSN